MGSIGDTLVQAGGNFGTALSTAYNQAFAAGTYVDPAKAAADAERSRIISAAMAAQQAAQQTAGNLTAPAPTAAVQPYSPPIGEQIFDVFTTRPWLMWVLVGLLILVFVWLVR